MFEEKVQEWKETKSISLAFDICERLADYYSHSHDYDAEDLIASVAFWGRDKGLNDPKAQLNKVIEEVGEMAHEICRNRYESGMMSDAIGDTLVTVIILADILGYDPIACLDEAYNTIKDRKGITKNGTFVKE